MLGNPKKVITDRGTAFTSQEFRKFLEERKINHTLIAVAAPWANGLVEGVNRFLKSSFSKLIDELQDWYENLDTVQYVLNNTYHSSLKSSPSKLLLGYDQRNHDDVILVDCLKKVVEKEISCKEVRETHRQIAMDTLIKIKNYNKIMIKHSKPTVYKAGDYVLIRGVIRPGVCKKPLSTKVRTSWRRF